MAESADFAAHGQPREHIAPDWTLGQLKDSFPGVELALFAFFGVGSRERAGFAASETLADLLRRHLVFDAQKACARLDALAAEDWQYQWTPQKLLDKLKVDQVAVIDARSSEDHARSRLAGSRLLSAQSVAELCSRPSREEVVVVCNDGSQSPAASRHLRGLGLRAGHLRGGLTAWSIDADESFPINYPLEEHAARWHLLADGQTLRFRRQRPLKDQNWRIWDKAALGRSDPASELLKALPGLTMVAVGPRTFAARGELGDLHRAAHILAPWADLRLWNGGGESSEIADERRRLERVLAVEAPRILQSHKGTVEIQHYTDRILGLRLGGGCAGCASASITTQRELAAALYREVPLLDRIQGDS
jgi:rhodanese-related sulfurtransferase/Fe-S cluster biogenesis protein NfuA